MQFFISFQSQFSCCTGVYFLNSITVYIYCFYIAQKVATFVYAVHTLLFQSVSNNFFVVDIIIIEI